MGLAAFNRARKIAADRLGKKSIQREVERLTEISFNELRVKAKGLNIEGYGKMDKEQLIEAIVGERDVGES